MNILGFAGFGFTSLAVLSTYLLTQAPSTYRLKWILIPAVIAFGVYLQLKLPLLLGAPQQGHPGREFALIEYRAIQFSDRRVIEAWVIEKGADDSSLWEFPYSDDTAQALQKIQQGHGTLRGQFQKGTHTGHDRSAPDMLDDQLTVVGLPQPPLPNKDGDGSEEED